MFKKLQSMFKKLKRKINQYKDLDRIFATEVAVACLGMFTALIFLPIMSPLFFLGWVSGLSIFAVVYYKTMDKEEFNTVMRDLEALPVNQRNPKKEDVVTEAKDFIEQMNQSNKGNDLFVNLFEAEKSDSSKNENQDTTKGV